VKLVKGIDGHRSCRRLLRNVVHSVHWIHLALLLRLTPVHHLLWKWIYVCEAFSRNEESSRALQLTMLSFEDIGFPH